jgi:hypothetical protein
VQPIKQPTRKHVKELRENMSAEVRRLGGIVYEQAILIEKLELTLAELKSAKWAVRYEQVLDQNSDLKEELAALRTHLAEAYRDADEVLRPELERVRTQLAESQEQVRVLREALVCGITILTVLNTVWDDKFSPNTVRDINDHTDSALSILAAAQPKEVNDEMSKRKRR